MISRHKQKAIIYLLKNFLAWNAIFFLLGIIIMLFVAFVLWDIRILWKFIPVLPLVIRTCVIMSLLNTIFGHWVIKK